MNPILSDIYSTAVPSAPFIIAAYALVWVALFVYVAVVTRNLKKAEAQMAALEEALAAKKDERGGRQEPGARLR